MDNLFFVNLNSQNGYIMVLLFFISSVHAKSAFEVMMRVKKSKERESDTKGMIVANVTKLVCTSKSQSDSLNGNVLFNCLI